VIDRRVGPDGEYDVTIADRIEETLRQGGFLHDAAARAGMTVETLRTVRRKGVQLRAKVLADPEAWRAMSGAERSYAEMAERMERAEADARTALLALSQSLARGGRTRTETTRRVDRNGRTLEVTEKVFTAEPDGRMIQWLLSHRWPEDFGRTRIEVSGPGGGAVEVDTTPIRAKVEAYLDKIGASAAASTRDALEEAAASGNGKSPTGNGHHEE